ncbi:lipocalin family protein [Chryseobacterium sp. JV558]|uniref:lipocalin family protein n=1 Tax=Chryseobacterium sp. JV558 TaxID=2663236 RepID=UPI00299EDA84|nr:lipocalin family protein [Chryseobacterium sp. JV558]
MRFFIGTLLLMSIASCSNDDDRAVVNEDVSINGSWKPYKYEFKGKDIMLTDCEKKGIIFINPDFSGSYERYDVSSSSGNCNLFDSFGGKWTFDKMYQTLTLTYTEAGVTKTLKKEIDSYSNTELKINDNSKNLDNTPGNDEGVLVFRKE